MGTTSERDDAARTTDMSNSNKGSFIPRDRRIVTVLFADIVGSTALIEKLDPEQALAILDPAVNAVAKGVERYGGTVLKRLGDGAMAIFGVPIIQEDHALRACHAALLIQEELLKLSASSALPSGINLQLRIGLHSGPVVLTSAVENGRTSYDTIGPTVSLASRIQTAAEPGTVGLSEQTFQLARRSFVCRRIGLKTLKGFAHPQTLYQLLEPQADRPIRGLVDYKIVSPLIGRERESQQIRSAIADLRSGNGGTLLIIGEAGIGKSRLIAETCNSLSQNILHLKSTSLSFGQRISYWPFIELLTPMFFRQEKRSDERRWAEFERNANEILGSEAPSLFLFVATLLGLEIPEPHAARLRHLDGTTIGANVFRAARRLFELFSQRQPLFIEFDDIHWFDRSSLEILEHLLPLANSHAILFCCLSRPDIDVLNDFHEVAARELGSRFQEVILAPFSVTESQALLVAILGDDGRTRNIRDLILYKAEGNPFFIEEVIRTLIDTRVVVRGLDGHWYAEDRAVVIPNTIQGVLLERFDRLDSRLKEVLGLAAVIGRTFLYRVLSAAIKSADNLGSQVEILSAIEIIEQLKSAPELSYLFRHALTHDAIYENLLVERRKQLHARVAECLELLFSDRTSEVTSVLAFHYARSEKWEKSLHYLLAAADQSNRMAADREALVYYEEAAAAYAKAYGDNWDKFERARIELRIGQLHFRNGEHAIAIEHLRRSSSRYGDVLPNTVMRLRLAEGSELARHVLVMGARLANGGGFARRFMPSVLKRRLRNAELQTSIAQPDEVRLQIYKTLISACWLADQKHLMLLILRSLNIADEMGTAESIAGAYAVMGFTLDHVGWSRLAKRYSDKALSFADRTSNAATVGLVYYFRGEHNFFKANWTEAEQAFLKAREASDGAGDLLFWASASKMLCEMWSETGDFTRVLAFAGEMIDLGRDAAFQPALRWGFSARGKAMRRLGQGQRARSDLEESLRLGIVSRDCIDIACAAGELALCILEQDGPDAAEELLERIQHELSFIRILPHTIWAIYLAAAEISLKRLEAEPSANGDVYRKAQLSCAKASRWARRYPFARAAALRLNARRSLLCGDLRAATRRGKKALRLAASLGARWERDLIERNLAFEDRQTSEIDRT